jgi:hypothetical protein
MVSDTVMYSRTRDPCSGADCGLPIAVNVYPIDSHQRSEAALILALGMVASHERLQKPWAPADSGDKMVNSPNAAMTRPEFR